VERVKMAGLPIPLGAVLHDLGGEFRKVGSIKFSSIRQVQEFTLRHDTVGERVEGGASRCSVGTGDPDGMVSQPFDNSTNVFAAPREAKDLHFASFG